MAVLHPHEEAIVRTFFDRRVGERWLRRLAYGEGTRLGILGELNHYPYLDPRFAHRIPPRDQTLEKIYQTLKAKGAPATCNVLGGDHDRRDMDRHAGGMGTGRAGLHHPIDVVGSDLCVVVGVLVAVLVAPILMRTVLTFVPGRLLDLVAVQEKKIA